MSPIPDDPGLGSNPFGPSEVSPQAGPEAVGPGQSGVQSYLNPQSGFQPSSQQPDTIYGQNTKTDPSSTGEHRSPAGAEKGPFTLDDMASLVKYTGFTSSSPSLAPPTGIESAQKASKNGYSTFHKNTISYTSTAGASASFPFLGSWIEVYGPAGPSYGCFDIVLDGQPVGQFNATRKRDTDGKAVQLWKTNVQGGQHQLEIKNAIEGGALSLDYFVSDEQFAAEWEGKGKTTGHGNTHGGVFPSDGKKEGSSAIGGIIGGILAACFILLFLYFWWRLRQYRKGGGEGSTMVALCGGRRKAETPEAGPGPGQFKVWPMIRSRPKYDTY